MHRFRRLRGDADVFEHQDAETVEENGEYRRCEYDRSAGHYRLELIASAGRSAGKAIGRHLVQLQPEPGRGAHDERNMLETTGGPARQHIPSA